MDPIIGSINQGRIDYRFLRAVQEGAAGWGISSEALPGIILIFVLLILLFFLAYLFHRCRRQTINRESLFSDEITSKDRMIPLLQKASEQRSSLQCLLNADDGELCLKGRLIRVAPDGGLMIEVSVPKDQGPLPEEIDGKVDFKLAWMDRVDYYCFYARFKRIMDLDDANSGGRLIACEAPDRLLPVQRRMHLRVCPTGRYRLWAEVFPRGQGSPQSEEEAPLSPPVAIQDISISGARMMIDNNHPAALYRPKDTIHLRFCLPAAGLGLEGTVPSGYITMEGEILQSEVVEKGNHQLRVRFTKRGFPSPDSGKLHFRPLNELMNEDISRWIHRYSQKRLSRGKAMPSAHR